MFYLDHIPASHSICISTSPILSLISPKSLKPLDDFPYSMVYTFNLDSMLDNPYDLCATGLCRWQLQGSVRAEPQSQHSTAPSTYNPVHSTSSFSWEFPSASLSLLCPDYLSIHERYQNLWRIPGKFSMVHFNFQVISVILKIHIIWKSFSHDYIYGHRVGIWVSLNLVKPLPSWSWGKCFPHNWHFNSQQIKFPQIWRKVCNDNFYVTKYILWKWTDMETFPHI